MSWAEKSATSPSRASGVLATTITPLVSLSRRCTMPGRSVAPPPPATRWKSSALTKVPPGWPGAGCTTSPGGLSRMRRWGSSKRIVRGMSSGKASVGGGGLGRTTMRAPATGRSRARAGSPSTSTRPSSTKRCTVVRDQPRPRAATRRSSRSPASASLTTISTGSIPLPSAPTPCPVPAPPTRRARGARGYHIFDGTWPLERTRMSMSARS